MRIYCIKPNVGTHESPMSSYRNGSVTLVTGSTTPSTSFQNSLIQVDWELKAKIWQKSRHDKSAALRETVNAYLTSSVRLLLCHWRSIHQWRLSLHVTLEWFKFSPAAPQIEKNSLIVPSIIKVGGFRVGVCVIDQSKSRRKTVWTWTVTKLIVQKISLTFSNPDNRR